VEGIEKESWSNVMGIFSSALQLLQTAYASLFALNINILDLNLTCPFSLFTIISEHWQTISDLALINLMILHVY
jgi:hypothetical protein